MVVFQIRKLENQNIKITNQQCRGWKKMKFAYYSTFTFTINSVQKQAPKKQRIIIPESKSKQQFLTQNLRNVEPQNSPPNNFNRLVNHEKAKTVKFEAAQVVKKQKVKNKNMKFELAQTKIPSQLTYPMKRFRPEKLQQSRISSFLKRFQKKPKQTKLNMSKENQSGKQSFESDQSQKHYPKQTKPKIQAKQNQIKNQFSQPKVARLTHHRHQRQIQRIARRQKICFYLLEGGQRETTAMMQNLNFTKKQDVQTNLHKVCSVGLKMFRAHAINNFEQKRLIQTMSKKQLLICIVRMLSGVQCDFQEDLKSFRRVILIFYMNEQKIKHQYKITKEEMKRTYFLYRDIYKQIQKQRS